MEESTGNLSQIRRNQSSQPKKTWIDANELQFTPSNTRLILRDYVQHQVLYLDYVTENIENIEVAVLFDNSDVIASKTEKDRHTPHAIPKK